MEVSLCLSQIVQENTEECLFFSVGELRNEAANIYSVWRGMLG
jgi:hypothetical protein